MDNEPEISLYEQIVLQASFACQDVNDICGYIDVYGISDKPQFLELVQRCINARN